MQIGFQEFVDNLYLSITLRMIGSAHVQLGAFKLE